MFWSQKRIVSKLIKLFNFKKSKISLIHDEKTTENTVRLHVNKMSAVFFDRMSWSNPYWGQITSKASYKCQETLNNTQRNKE